jgi:hypothetical protein
MIASARWAPMVAVLLLASVGTASAECAWMVWVKEGDGDAWSVRDSVPTYTECVAYLKAARKALAARPDTTAKHTGGLIVVSRKVGGAVVVTQWHCLPDTIDPRGPKGK